MKHKHAELIKQWADGAEIEWSCDFKYWNPAFCPTWDENKFYRIKPTSRPQWQQDLIDAAKAGKVVEYLTIHNEWVRSSLNSAPELNVFIQSSPEKFRIRPEKVTRYLWAYGYGNEWRTSTTFMTIAEARLSKYEKRLDWTATEFEE